MGVYEDRAKLLWSLSGSTGGGTGTTISANGNSGGFGDTSPAPFPSSAIGLELASDLQLMVYINGKTLTPSFTVGLGYYDSLGHLFAPTTLQLPNITVTTVPTTAALNAGVRAGSSGTTYFAFPQWGQVYWTISGGTVTGVEIQLWGK